MYPRRVPGLQTPLHDVVFCAVDLETTGMSPRTCEIVEIGAVKSRCGEPMGTFETLVRPSGVVPASIQTLTGIRPAMLDLAVSLHAALPSLLEFVRSAVFVAHNARFDYGFLASACDALCYERPQPLVVDTATLARRLLKGEVPDNRLSTLAEFLRVPEVPRHRAYVDAAACLGVLHALIERAWAYGVQTLGDLLEVERAPSTRHLEKLRLTRDLPRSPGVFVLLNPLREVIYVGRAADMRAHVRALFLSRPSRATGRLGSEASAVRAFPGDGPAALSLEAELLRRHAPRHNRREGVTQGRRPRARRRVFGGEGRTRSADNGVE